MNFEFRGKPDRSNIRVFLIIYQYILFYNALIDHYSLLSPKEDGENTTFPPVRHVLFAKLKEVSRSSSLY